MWDRVKTASYRDGSVQYYLDGELVIQVGQQGVMMQKTLPQDLQKASDLLDLYRYTVDRQLCMTMAVH